MRRYLCSHLVTLNWNAGERVVNLEEIWETGAVLDCEQALAHGIAIEIRAERGVYFAGLVNSCEEHEFGWRVEMKFSPLTPWSAETFRPEHLLDLTEIARSGGTKTSTGSP